MGRTSYSRVQSAAQRSGVDDSETSAPAWAKAGGRHLLADFWEARHLDDIAYIERALRQAAEAAGATVLHGYCHRFAPNGVTGVLVLAESHISIHTWPDHQYAAVDIFMCGRCDPHDALRPLQAAFEAQSIETREVTRGQF